MGQIVPFYAADQGICDTLCDIIRQLVTHEGEDPDTFLTEKQNEMLGRILKD